MKLIAGIAFTVFLIATCDTFGFKFSLNRDTLPCKTIGVDCDCEEEKRIYYCSKIGADKIPIGECSADEYCDEYSKPTYCKPKRNQSCINDTLTCETTGVVCDCDDENSIYYCMKVGEPKMKLDECGVDEYCDAKSPTYCKPERNPSCINGTLTCETIGVVCDCDDEKSIYYCMKVGDSKIKLDECGVDEYCDAKSKPTYCKPERNPSCINDTLTCETIGVVCDCHDEKSIYYCSKVGDPKIKEGECGDDEYCDAKSKPTYCKPEKNPSCHNNIKFICTSAGLFPDPFQCDKYHICTNSNDNIVMLCPNGYYFNIASGDCDTKTCDREQLDCTAPMDSNHTYPYDNTMYFTCVVEDGIKVPILYKCEKGKFDDTTKQCSDANDETTTPEITTPTPEETTITPDSPTTPDDTTPTPEITTPTPEETTITADSSTTPDDTTPTQEITTPTPEETTITSDSPTPRPDDTTSTPKITTPTPEETTITPDSSTIPNDTTSTPEITTLPPSPTPPACDNRELYPDEMDCYYYYDCRNGTAVRRKCPSGYHFSKEMKKCDKGECTDPTRP